MLEDLDLSAVPLFPLPSVVLFPRAVLPLHIFEDRYRAMTADALDSDRLIAMALLKPGWEKSYYGRPAIEPVVCVGRIVSHEKLSDGKYNFLLEGVARARIVQELAIELAYRVAELTKIEQVPASESSLQEQRRQLIELFTKSPLARTGVGQQFGQMFAKGWPTPEICDLAAFTFLDDIVMKQSLLAEPDVRGRVDQVVESLQKIAQLLPKALKVSPSANPSLN
jgi:ATP-dependent Lon protease